MRWKITKLVRNSKPGKDKGEDVTKFRTIVLLNPCGKLREKLFKTELNHHVFSHNYMYKNQYGFTPQKSTNFAGMTLKNFATDGLRAEDVVVIVSLDVKDNFDADGWPEISNGPRAY